MNPGEQVNGRIGVDAGNVVVELVSPQGALALRLSPQKAAEFLLGFAQAFGASCAQVAAAEAVKHMCPDCVLKFSRAQQAQAEQAQAAANGGAARSRLVMQ